MTLKSTIIGPHSLSVDCGTVGTQIQLYSVKERETSPWREGIGGNYSWGTFAEPICPDPNCLSLMSIVGVFWACVYAVLKIDVDRCFH